VLRIAAYSLDLPGYACSRLRLLGPAGRLAGRVEMRWAAASDGADYAIDAQAMEGADLVIFQRYFPMEATWPLVERALSSGVPVVYESDDNFLAVPEDHPMRERLAPVVPFARELLARASLATVSTPELARAFAGIAREVAVLPNCLDERLWGGLGGALSRPDGQQRLGGPERPVRTGMGAPDFPGGQAHDPPGEAGDTRGRGGVVPVRVAFAGTSSHAPDLERIAPALRRVKERFGEGVEFIFMGAAPQGFEPPALPFEAGYGAYAARLAGIRPDIGLAPLSDNPFNRCKSAVKWLEYSALCAAGVYADLPPYKCVRHGETGLKAGEDPKQWEEALAFLVADEAQRRLMGARAREEVLSRWRLGRGAEAYYSAWKRAAHGKS
jgi:glycosyltransferase involved in cell wall biosynthesis